MHAFRHTLLTYGAMQTPPLFLISFTGHAQGKLPVPAIGASKGYMDAELLGPIDDKAALLNQLDYGLEFFTPATQVVGCTDLAQTNSDIV